MEWKIYVPHGILRAFHLSAFVLQPILKTFTSARYPAQCVFGYCCGQFDQCSASRKGRRERRSRKTETPEGNKGKIRT